MYISSLNYVENNSFNNDLWTGITTQWGSAPGTGNVNSDAIWNACNISDQADIGKLNQVGSNPTCWSSLCLGHFGKWAPMQELAGICTANDIDTNPSCQGPPRHMVFAVSCLYRAD